jgi:multiple sugar transport system substrate-binding protein
MESTYSDAKVTEVDAKVDGYYSLMREQGPLFAGAPAFPFHNTLRESIDPFIWQSLAGEMDAAAALDGACAAAEATMQQLGYGD